MLSILLERDGTIFPDFTMSRQVKLRLLRSKSITIYWTENVRQVEQGVTTTFISVVRCQKIIY